MLDYISSVAYFGSIAVTMLSIQILPLLSLVIALIQLFFKVRVKTSFLTVLTAIFIKIGHDRGALEKGHIEIGRLIDHIYDHSLLGYTLMFAYIYLFFWFIHSLVWWIRKYIENRFKEVNDKRDKGQARVNRKRKVLVLFCILAFLPFILFTGYYSHQYYLQETLIVESHSPRNINKIEVFEKGKPAFIGPSMIEARGHSLVYIKRPVFNNGNALSSRNVLVIWEGDYRATIILQGKGQEDEKIQFIISSKTGEETFKVLR
ncbi:hypothetical protein HPB58_17195 [Priestia filamentosa]|uniref:hypothetical protein n=1 Tax=Priestia filamentosa TaxID=1402861 RepID=UPI001FB22F1E|nr:hypothetical protein [Priestia filamentosa]MED3729160.1 hypothetical protein [Priestia filamentosa]UOE59050.1 hypothetical protein HPB58_17195 [Priestia filamentosa]